MFKIYFKNVSVVYMSDLVVVWCTSVELSGFIQSTGAISCLLLDTVGLLATVS